MSDADEMYQVVMHPALDPHFKAWLDLRGLRMFRMPDFSEDDLPTYGIGPKEWLK